jgi:hypothetical protein
MDMAETALEAEAPEEVSSLLDETLGEPLGDILAGQASALDVV